VHTLKPAGRGVVDQVTATATAIMAIRCLLFSPDS
jgi:hypothetical protein